MVKDYQILRETVKKVLADSPLDIGAKYFVLSDIFRDVEAEYFGKINGELMEGEEVRSDAESV